MTTTLNHPKDLTFYIAYNDDKSVIHYGSVDTEQCMETALNNIEQFLDEEEYKARKKELGVVEEYKARKKELGVVEENEE